MLLLKQAGFNAVRCAHNPASKALLRACDKLGMYVMDEAFDMWAKMKNPADYSLFFGIDYPRVLEAMVRSDYNHPSVIMYSTGNEIMDIATDKGYELSSELTACLRKLDDTRLITNAINALLSAGNRLVEITAQANGDTLESLKGIDVNQYMAQHRMSMGQVIAHESISDVLEHLDATMDVIGYNYMTDRYETDSLRYPHRVIVGAETHAPRIADNWRLMQEHANIIGDFIWTSYSYLGETGGKDHFPTLQNESCDLDITGCRMPTSYYRAVVLGQREQPYIAVRTPKDSQHPIMLTPWSLTDAIHCWDYPGHEGEATEVEVYSAGEEVELFLNGVSCGRKPAGEKRPCQTVFRVPYQPGELKAVSLCGGKAVSSDVLFTTGKATGFHLVRETCPVEKDLIFVTVQAVNAQGQPVYAAIDDLTVTIEGESVQLQAFGSWEAPHNGGYQNPVLPIRNGQALVILRKRSSGQSRLTVSAVGMEAATQVVES